MNYGKRLSLPKFGGIPQIARKQRRENLQNKMYNGSSDQDEEVRSGSGKRISRNLSEKKRRDQFNSLIQELNSMVSTKNRKMDKSAVLRCTISFLRAHNDMALKSEKNTIKENWKPSFLSDDEFSQLMLEALDGFMMVFSQQGHILYTSDSITSLLRHLPSDLSNQTIYELVHEDDRPDIYKILAEADEKIGRPDVLTKKYTFQCHMRIGTHEATDPVQYELVTFDGNFTQLNNSDVAFPGDAVPTRYCFVATVRLKNTQLNREMATFNEGGNEFLSRHSLDWKFLYLDHRGPPIIGYLPFEVLGTSVYEYYHQDDLDKLARCHEILMQTSEGTSCYYRFLTKGQEWIWLQTRYFITYHQWNSKPEFIVCTHKVVNYAEVRSEMNKELNLTDDSMMTVSESDSGAIDSSSSECPSLSSSASLDNSGHKSSDSLTMYGSQSQYFSSGGSQSDDNSSLVSTNSRKPLTGSPRLERKQGLGMTSSSGGGIPQQIMEGQQNMAYPLSPSPSYDSSSPSREDDRDPQLPQDQLAIIQLKLQEQLVSRHRKLQEAIMQQQQELQQVQQQLLAAQTLIVQNQPFLQGLNRGPQEQAQQGQQQQQQPPPPMIIQHTQHQQQQQQQQPTTSEWNGHSNLVLPSPAPSNLVLSSPAPVATVLSSAPNHPAPTPPMAHSLSTNGYSQSPYSVSRLNPHTQQMTTGPGRALLSPPNPTNQLPQHSSLAPPVQLTSPQHLSLQQQSQSAIHGHSSSSNATGLLQQLPPSSTALLQQLPPPAHQAPPSHPAPPTMAFSTQDLGIPPGMDFMGQFVLPPSRTNDS